MPAEENLTFRHKMPIQIRFNDVDRYGHVNNNAYFSYYDLGKVDYLSSVLNLYAGTPDVVPVIANINADFFMPVFYGDDIVVETCIPHVGTKSFTLVQRAINRATGVEKYEHTLYKPRGRRTYVHSSNRMCRRSKGFLPCR